MMSDKRAVRVGDMVNGWNLSLPEYDGCEFKAFAGSSRVQITKVPDPEPEIPDEPMTRGSVVTFEGDSQFIAVRPMGDVDLSHPFVVAFSAIGPCDHFSWSEIVSRAAGRKIIVHKMVDPDEVYVKAPVKVHTYAEWLILPEDEQKKYKWMDDEGDLWSFSDQSGKIEVEGEGGNIFTLGNKYFPLTRCEKIG